MKKVYCVFIVFVLVTLITSPCRSQEVIVSYDKSAKSINVTVTNNTDGKMFIINSNPTRASGSDVCLQLKDIEQETLHATSLMLMCKGDTKPKNSYVISARSKIEFQMNLYPHLNILDYSRLKKVKRINLNVMIVYSLETNSKSLKPILVNKNYDF